MHKISAAKYLILKQMRNYDLSYSDVTTDKQQYAVVLQTWDLAIESDAQRAQEKDTDYYICFKSFIFYSSSNVVM